MMIASICSPKKKEITSAKRSDAIKGLLNWLNKRRKSEACWFSAIVFELCFRNLVSTSSTVSPLIRSDFKVVTVCSMELLQNGVLPLVIPIGLNDE